MRVLLNILWMIFGGLITALIWALLGIVLLITIIGIPFGLQLFKYAELMLMPFGSKVETNFNKRPIINVIWIIFFGWALSLGYIALGVLCCITIIGIPFGLQWFKFVKLSFLPFGAEIV